MITYFLGVLYFLSSHLFLGVLYFLPVLSLQLLVIGPDSFFNNSVQGMTCGTNVTKIDENKSMNSRSFLTLVPLILLFTLTVDANPKSAQTQKEAIGHMHNELHSDQAPYKTNEALALKELNEMTIRDDVKIEDVNNKIDELMTAKTQIMRLRYAHLIEMRATLTEEQRVGYDKRVLKRSAVE